MDKKVQQELLNKISDFINQASHTLGQTAAHVYTILVRQQLIDGIGGVLSLIVFLALVYFPSRAIISRAWKWHKDDDMSEGAIVVLILGPLIVIVMALIVSAVLQSSVEKILNPEYYAIQFIFDKASGN